MILMIIINYFLKKLKLFCWNWLWYTKDMIKIIAGGKKNKDWLLEACAEYEKRLRKPFDVTWQFVEESELSYGCTCTKRSVKKALVAALSGEDLSNMEEVLEISCKLCGKKYHIEKSEL